MGLKSHGGLKPTPLYFDNIEHQLTHTVPTILSRIVERKREELAQLRASRDALGTRAELGVNGRRDFRASLLASPPAIIAEVKKASPSKGILSTDFDPVRIARQYESGGASALSVLTDEHFFQGSLADLEAARAATNLPVLRKDFTLEEIHVVEAAAHGADAILLIAALLDEHALRRLRSLAAEFRMAALVEVHDGLELERALASGAEIVGVNNRDLNTFQVTLETSLALAARIPSDAVKVSESGIHSAEDVRRLQEAGFQAFLVGEHLMKTADPAAALKALRA
ncbi:MAG: indole-3-glycerol phosphate synthase TrpC [Bryobacteraceae bacterium]